MNKQLIKKEDLSIFDRIKSFFKSFFFNKKMMTKNVEENSSKKNFKFGEKLKVDVSVIREKEDELKKIIKEIESNPDIVEKLSDERLNKLINYYEKVTNSKRIKIEKLKAYLN